MNWIVASLEAKRQPLHPLQRAVLSAWVPQAVGVNHPQMALAITMDMVMDMEGTVITITVAILRIAMACHLPHLRKIAGLLGDVMTAQIPEDYLLDHRQSTTTTPAEVIDQMDIGLDRVSWTGAHPLQEAEEELQMLIPTSPAMAALTGEETTDGDEMTAMIAAILEIETATALEAEVAALPENAIEIGFGIANRLIEREIETVFAIVISTVGS